MEQNPALRWMLSHLRSLESKNEDSLTDIEIRKDALRVAEQEFSQRSELIKALREVVTIMGGSLDGKIENHE